MYFKVIVTVDLTFPTRVQGSYVESTIKRHIESTNKLGNFIPKIDGNYRFTVLKGKLEYNNEYGVNYRYRRKVNWTTRIMFYIIQK